MSAGNELLLYRVNFCERPVAPSLHSLTETLRVQRVLALGRRLVGADPPRDYSGPPYQGRGLLAGLAEDVAYLSWRRAGAGCGGPRSAVQ